MRKCLQRRIVSLVVGCMCSALSVAVILLVIEIVFVIILFVEIHKYSNE